MAKHNMRWRSLGSNYLSGIYIFLCSVEKIQMKKKQIIPSVGHVIQWRISKNILSTWATIWQTSWMTSAV